MTSLVATRDVSPDNLAIIFTLLAHSPADYFQRNSDHASGSKTLVRKIFHYTFQCLKDI